MGIKANVMPGISLLLLIAGCGDRYDPIRVDIVLYNGRVLTMDAAGTIASAVVIDDGVIVAVGDDNLLDRYEALRPVNLRDTALLPGFIDSHTHIRGRPRRHIDLSTVDSIEALMGRVSDKADELGQGEWITGYGWSEDAMEEKRRPLRSDLDRAAPMNPVLLTRAGGHSAVANSLALEWAGVDRNTPDPDGGVIERDESGELNGVIRERQEIVARLIPEASDDDVRVSLIAGLRKQLSLGITSIVHASDTIDHYAEWRRIYDVLGDELPRATVQLAWEGADAMAEFRRNNGADTDHLRVGAIKIFVDGRFTGTAAYTKEPYRGETDYRGKLNMPVSELSTIIREAHAGGWQLGIHAIGDAAIELVVNQLVAALNEMPRDDHRHYLNHFTVMPSSQTMNRMAANGIAITQQPNFTYTLEGRYVEYLDDDRLQHNNALRTPMDHGIHVAISSDILPVGPMVGIYAAVTRKGMSGEVYGAGEALTVMEALRAYTAHGAWLTFEEDRKGTIETGKLADLVQLDRDITDIDPDEILDVRVERTWLGGKQVYRRSK